MGPKPYWQSECGRAVVYVGDNLHVMTAEMESQQFHAVVTDSPYGLEFMGKEWDAPWKKVDDRTVRADEMNDPVKAKYLRHNVEYVRDSKLFQEWFFDRAGAMLRVAKPGAHLLSFGGTRMWHRMACAVEDAGWEIRDTIMWVYGNGFPKGLDVSQAIDRELGFERTKVVGPGTAALSQGQFNAREAGSGGYGYSAEYSVMEPATDAARQWQGWNTVLKPALEPIVMARKPVPDNVARCALENGTGAINVDGCRVGSTGTTVEKTVTSRTSSGSGVYKFNSDEAGEQSMSGGFIKATTDGRYPTNLIHDGSEEVVVHFPDGATRLYYTAKADHTDRPHGKDATIHPTVKPLDLMRYLVRLVCVPGGTVLDPFMGSGSTGCAAILEGMRFVGIEQSQEYADIAVGRLKLALADRKVEDTPELNTGMPDRKAGTRPPPKKLRGA